VKLVEPPSCSSGSSIVFIGRNSRGNWVAQEQNGLYGGLFVNRAQAVKYALFENGQRPETIVELSHEIELDMGGRLPSADRLPAARTRARRMTSRPSGGMTYIQTFLFFSYEMKRQSISHSYALVGTSCA
jgi:hypothetical protein